MLCRVVCVKSFFESQPFTYVNTCDLWLLVCVCVYACVYAYGFIYVYAYCPCVCMNNVIYTHNIIYR